jgi:hypothetical protein
MTASAEAPTEHNDGTTAEELEPADTAASEGEEEEGEDEEVDGDFHAGAAELGVDQIPSACMY